MEKTGTNELEGSKNEAVALLTVMSSLLHLLNGGVLDEVGHASLKAYVMYLGYPLRILEEEPMLRLLQHFCKDYSELSLDEYEDDNLVS